MRRRGTEEPAPEKEKMMSKAPSYKAAVKEIEEIVEEIENESIDVDGLTEKVKRAAFLIRSCRENLKKTEKEVEKVLKEFDTEVVDSTPREEGPGLLDF